MKRWNIKIVADSSADTLKLENVPYAVAPLKIITSEKEYVDDENLDAVQMVEDLLNYNGKSSTSCPSVMDWLEAFDDAKFVFCVTITSGLSASYDSACMAKKEYEEKFPDRKVFVIDSLSAGPELRLIIEKLRELIHLEKTFEEIKHHIMEYKKNTGLVFMLESMKNLANNGRVSPIAAKLAGVLGIRAIGKASDKGTLEMLEKSRGEKKALSTIIHHMKKEGSIGGKVKIGHCCNEGAAKKLKDLIKGEFESAQVDIYPSTGLCSFYQEKGGLMIGFEKNMA